VESAGLEGLLLAHYVNLILEDRLEKMNDVYMFGILFLEMRTFDELRSACVIWESLN